MRSFPSRSQLTSFHNSRFVRKGFNRCGLDDPEYQPFLEPGTRDLLPAKAPARARVAATMKKRAALILSGFMYLRRKKETSNQQTLDDLLANATAAPQGDTYRSRYFLSACRSTLRPSIKGICSNTIILTGISHGFKKGRIKS